jgi:hypothetical protein
MNRQIVILSLACCLVMTSASRAASSPQTEPNAVLAGSSTKTDAPLPSGDELIQRVLDHFTAKAAETNVPVWAFDKVEVSEELDSDAKVKERTEKVYRTRIVQGLPVSRLIKKDGRVLTEAEIKKEDEREDAMKKEFGGPASKKEGKQHEDFNAKDTIKRFEWNALRREAVHGRQTVVVSFQPKPGKDKGSIVERMMNRLAGTIWVDETTGDLAQLEVHLTKELSMGIFGVLGSVKDCRIDLVSTPMTDGAWVPEKTTFSVSARMFLSSLRFKMEQTSSNFALEPAPAPAQH